MQRTLNKHMGKWNYLGEMFGPFLVTIKINVNFEVVSQCNTITMHGFPKIEPCKLEFMMDKLKSAFSRSYFTYHCATLMQLIRVFKPRSFDSSWISFIKLVIAIWTFCWTLWWNHQNLIKCTSFRSLDLLIHSTWSTVPEYLYVILC